LNSSVKQSLARAAVRTGVALTRILPKKLWLRIREESALTGRLDYDNAPIYLAVDSWIESDVRLASCGKEPETIEWIETWFRPGDVFYDIGANVGAYSLVASGWLKGNVNIYAFEPGFMNFVQLCKNIQLNGADKVITPLQIGLSDQAGIMPFHYQNLFTGGALHALGESVDQRGRQFQPVFTLPTLTFALDDFIERFKLLYPSHIKIDVDGTELHILRGAQALLSRPELRTILIEIDKEQQNSDKVIEMIENAGFSLVSQRNENRVYCRNGLKP